MKVATYTWNLRQVMADKGLFNTQDLAPLLEQRGVHLSGTHVYRLVTGKPERLNLAVLAAICDALDVTPSDLISTSVIARPARRAQAVNAPVPSGKDDPLPRPVRATILPE